jgi:methyltransferase (TIGR00027 family)
MKDGTASRTARSVAARRLEYERVPAPYGDPAADEALTSDVADGFRPAPGGMDEYIRARTAFFDRVVVTALDRGVKQVVNAGAGYDGRALRYAKPGVRWFEVDHPGTQADKRERLARLGLATPQLTLIPADFTADPVAEPLLAAGLDPARVTLFLFEGVMVYLDQPVTERVLREFREVTPAGSVLAISVSIASATSQTRARFQERVAEIGEPARTVLTFDQASDLLTAAGWKVRQPSDRQRSAGLLLAHATAASAGPGRQRLTQPPATGRPAAPAPAEPSAGHGQERRRGPDPAAEAGPGRVRAAAVRAGSGAGASRRSPEGASQLVHQPPESLPLSALLSQTLVAFTIEVDNETERRLPHRTSQMGRAAGSPPGAPWLTSMLMYANCLRHLPDPGVTVAELHARARTGTNLDGMRRWRYVTYSPDPGHGKRPKPDALIRPTVWGIEARDTWRAVTEEVESRWRGRLGEEEFGALRAALTELVAHLDPALPDCLPILGFGLRAKRDSRADTGPSGKADESGPDLVPPAPGGAPRPAFPAALAPRVPPPAADRLLAADLPLWALLSRPLNAFADQYEAEPGPSLAIGANILRVLTAEGVYTKDIPVLAGVSKESVAMATGFLSRNAGLVTEGPDPAGSRFKLTRLTPEGTEARDEYPALAADIERDWRARFGDPTLTAVRQALEPLVAGDPPRLYAGLEPYPGNWRARRPAPATLPHFPLTLHRGGYPDGS